MKSRLLNWSSLIGFGKPKETPKGIPNPEELNLRQLPVLRAEELIQICGYSPELPELFRLVGIQEVQFDRLYKNTVYAFAEAVQLAPASESHHHSGPGGLLKHTLEVVHAALMLRKGHQLPRHGEPEVIVAQEHAWTFGVFAGALLHDVGKVMSRSPLILSMCDGTEKLWTPHDQPLRDIAPDSYRIAFREAPYRAHHWCATTLFSVLLPAVSRGWLANYPHILSQLIAYLWGDEYESQDIGEIVVKADRDSTAKNLGSSPDTMRFPGAKESTADKLMNGLRQLLGDNELKLNQNGAAGWIHNDYAYFVCKPLAEKLQGYLSAQSVTGIPTDTKRVYDVLQEGGYALSTADGQAIWNVTVTGENYQHSFTCLKFEARRLFSHNRTLPRFAGVVNEGGIESVATPTEAAPVSNNQTPAAPAPAPAPSFESAPSNQTVPAPVQHPAEIVPQNESVPVSPVAPPQPVAPPPSQDTVPVQESAENPVPTPVIMPTSPVRPPTDSSVTVTPIQRPVSQPAVPTTVSSTLPTADEFIEWVRSGIKDKSLQVNNTNACIHFVEEGVMLVSPKMFKLYCSKVDLTGEKDFVNIQKRLSRSKHLVKGQLTQKSVLTFIGKKAGGGEFKLNGMVLPYNHMFEPSEELPEKNKFLSASPNN